MITLQKKLCLGLGLVLLIGVSVPVYASDTNNTTKSNTQIQEPVFIDVVIPGKPEPIPTDGDPKSLNVGWSNVQGTYYYCKDESRVKVTSWQEIDGKLFYFDPTTYKMETGWLKNGDSWYYLIEPELLIRGKVNPKYGLGSMKTGWLQINRTWYYFDKNGALKTGWFSEGGKWYYFLETTHINKEYIDPEKGLLGAMQTGGLRDNDKIYYFNQNGIMQTGWVQDNGKWHYFNQDGSMVVDTTIDGCNIGADGAWIQ